jgi:hypothetical protein
LDIGLVGAPPVTGDGAIFVGDEVGINVGLEVGDNDDGEYLSQKMQIPSLLVLLVAMVSPSV